MSQIQYISVDKLDAHPDNPRKDLGDLTEIAASIKANGILQNLTVVPLLDATVAPNDAPFDGDPPFGYNPSAERYRIVIGHRRLAAAKLAGLAEVPCVVSDMPRADQVRTMLMENMQRSDLTVYEQAYGFQMMLDLGDNMDEIATKTGFSESTIRRRVKLLELDSDKFRNSVDRGATLFDYAELEKIKDLEKRNAVLDKVGTDNFKYALRQALDAQKNAEQMDALATRLSEFATEVENRSEYSNTIYIQPYTTLAARFLCLKTLPAPSDFPQTNICQPHLSAQRTYLKTGQHCRCNNCSNMYTPTSCAGQVFA